MGREIFTMGLIFLLEILLEKHLLESFSSRGEISPRDFSRGENFSRRSVSSRLLSRRNLSRRISPGDSSRGEISPGAPREEKFLPETPRENFFSAKIISSRSDLSFCNFSSVLAVYAENLCSRGAFFSFIFNNNTQHHPPQ